MNNPRDAFRNFLERAEQDAWISSYRWTEAESYVQLKQKLNGSVEEGFSRTHKKGTDGIWWGLEVEAHYGTKVGIDLEIFMSRPIFDRPQWITERLNLPKNTQPMKILEEWSCREAAFKSLSPQNTGLLMSHFRRTAPNTYTVYASQREQSVQVRSFWAGRWTLSLAWRTHS